MRAAFALALALALAACGSEETPPWDSEEENGGETYSEYDARRDSNGGSQGTFAGKGCTSDCSGHEAGYAWAEEKGITEPESCGGNSWSFIEGCRAYAEGQAGE